MRLITSLALLALACGNGGPGTFNGTVKGNHLVVSDAILVANTEVWLSSTQSLCPLLHSNQLPKNAAIVKLLLHPVATGDFAVDPSTATAKDHTAFMQFLQLDDTCANKIVFGDSIATKGTVTVNRFDDMKYIGGTFDVTFGGSDAVTGSFNAAFCDAPTSGTTTPDCK